MYSGNLRAEVVMAMPTKRNRAERCAHCGAAGELICASCRAAGHAGESMFGCSRCVAAWNDVEAQIARVCGRTPCFAKPIDDGAANA